MGKVFLPRDVNAGERLTMKDLMEKTEYIFIGAGGHARVMASVIESNQDDSTCCF